MVEFNVIEQVINIFKTAVVQRARRDSLTATRVALPRVHAAAYDPSNGHLNELEVREGNSGSGWRVPLV